MNCGVFVILALCVLTSLSVLFRLADKKKQEKKTTEQIKL
jgi:hypothetical protein